MSGRQTPHIVSANRFDHRLENWQAGLRKQYFKRGPDANPLGPEPPAPSRMQSRDPATPVEHHEDETMSRSGEQPQETSRQSATEDERDNTAEPEDDAEAKESPSGEPEAEEIKQEETEGSKVHVEGEDGIEQKPARDFGSQTVESRDWQDLSMLEKLDSLHLLTEWQFQNPHRLRQIMKDDGDHGLWVSVHLVHNCISLQLVLPTET